MKHRIISLLAIIGLLSLSACMQDHPNISDTRKEVKVYATIQGAQNQKVKSRATDTNWGANDAIGLFMKKSDADLTTSTLASNAKYALSDGVSSFSAVDELNKIYFPFHNESVDFIAYYPYTASLEDLNYTVDVSDQSSLSNIDLMYSNNAVEVNSSSDGVELEFKHQLSNVILNISMIDTHEQNITGLKAKITNVNTKASFSLKDGTLSDETTPADVTFKIASDGKTARAILLPMDPLIGKSLVLTLGSSEYFYDLGNTINIKSFAKSSKYTFNIKLKPGQGPEIDGVTATIEDWEDGGEEDIVADEKESTNGESSGEGDNPPEGNETPEGNEPPEEDANLGDGTEGSPYNVNQLDEKIGEEDKWIQGYIVGFYDSNARKSFVNNNVGNISLKDIAISSKPDETDSLKTFRISLSSLPETANVKKNLNLETNPDNFKKKAVFYGNIEELRNYGRLTKITRAVINEIEYLD